MKVDGYRFGEILKNALLRISGIAPLVGPLPLTERDYRNLFKAEVSFADYFPVQGFDAETGVFSMADGINVGAVWECIPADLDAKPEETLEAFNEMLAKALVQLPQEADNPYIVQIFLQNAEIENLGDRLQRNLPERLRNDKLSLDVARIMREHSDILTHELGGFPGFTRCPGQGLACCLAEDLSLRVPLRERSLLEETAQESDEEAA